jgi:Tfp pilus assembly protein PilF
MARYDRIAPLSSPARDHAFPAWPVLRDLEGQDRDVDVCRRARLRFLALRPVCRLIGRSADAVSSESYGKQISAVREELGSLSLRDVERARVTRFLRQIEDRDPKRLVAALIEFGEQANDAGHLYAAQEYALTANALAPNSADDLIARIARGDVEPESDYTASLESSLNELRTAEDTAARARILERMGRALMALRLFTPADRCFTLLTQRVTDLSVRARARAAHALLAALMGNGATFHERRSALLNDDAEWAPDPRVAANIHIDLAHGSVVTGDTDFAREHLRVAIALARRQSYNAMLKRAENILTALEQNSDVLMHPQPSTTEAVQRLAAQIELLDLPTPAN